MVWSTSLPLNEDTGRRKRLFTHLDSTKNLLTFWPPYYDQKRLGVKYDVQNRTGGQEIWQQVSHARGGGVKSYVSSAGGHKLTQADKLTEGGFF